MTARVASPTAMERLDAIIAMPTAALASAGGRLADELLLIGETALESWVRSRGETPTEATVGGLPAAGAAPPGRARRAELQRLPRDLPRAGLSPQLRRRRDRCAETVRKLRLGAMVARHLVLFIDGKLETAGLGEFCCSSRAVRQHDAASAAGTI